MVHPVAHHQILRSKHAIIALDLQENLLRDGNLGGFVLHNQARSTALAGKKHTVATARNAAHLNANLIGQEGRGISEVSREIMYEMLAHPLLGRQGNVSTTQRIVHKWTPLGIAAQAKGSFGKLERGKIHTAKVRKKPRSQGKSQGKRERMAFPQDFAKSS